MEIISKSNQGFRTRPSFQKIANKPNKEINYVVNPLQAVRDSYEFSNLINGEIDVEDEIKNKITDEIFHDEVQKEIGRRQTMEENRQQRTAADLRGNIPTTLPEMAAQQRVEPDFFDISDDNEVPTQVMEVDPVPDQVPEPIQPMEVEESQQPVEKMDEEEPSRKRILESKEERIKKVGKGTEVIKNISELFNRSQLTKPMIQ